MLSSCFSKTETRPTSKDEKLFQRIFDLFDPLVREGWTVYRGGGGLTLCVCAQPGDVDKDGNRPVVAYKIDRDTIDRKEMSFNVI